MVSNVECITRDCIRFVEGDRVETQAVLKQEYDLMFFTGGQFVGKMVAEVGKRRISALSFTWPCHFLHFVPDTVFILKAAAKNLTPTVLELGGKSPCIVDRSADLRIAALRVTWGTFVNSGQTCLRPDYLLVHEDVAEDFYKEMEKVRGHRVEHSGMATG